MKTEWTSAYNVHKRQIGHFTATVCWESGQFIGYFANTRLKTRYDDLDSCKAAVLKLAKSVLLRALETL